MTDPVTPAPSAAPAAGSRTELEGLRTLLAVSTQRLLGDTIAVTDEDWRGPSRLPGWSRGHVATHLARQADALRRVTEGARTGERQAMYASSEQRDAEIAAGADRSGLDLQIDLDTTAGHLGDAFDTLEELDAWDTEVELHGGLRCPARLLPLARLLEVVLHHVDLDVGLDMGDVDPATAEWLLEWCCFRLRHRDEFPQLRLVTDTGFTSNVGSSGASRTVSGSSAALLGWLTGRTGPETVEGTEALLLPAF